MTKLKKLIEKNGSKTPSDKFNQLGEEQQLAAKNFKKFKEAYQHLKKERSIK